MSNYFVEALRNKIREELDDHTRGKLQEELDERAREKLQEELQEWDERAKWFNLLSVDERRAEVARSKSILAGCTCGSGPYFPCDYCCEHMVSYRYITCKHAIDEGVLPAQIIFRTSFRSMFSDYYLLCDRCSTAEDTAYPWPNNIVASVPEPWGTNDYKSKDPNYKSGDLMVLCKIYTRPDYAQAFNCNDLRILTGCNSVAGIEDGDSQETKCAKLAKLFNLSVDEMLKKFMILHQPRYRRVN